MIAATRYVYLVPDQLWPIFREAPQQAPRRGLHPDGPGQWVELPEDVYDYWRHCSAHFEAVQATVQAAYDLALTKRRAAQS